MIRVNIKQIASVSYERYSPANDQLLKKKRGWQTLSDV